MKPSCHTQHNRTREATPIEPNQAIHIPSGMLLLSYFYIYFQIACRVYVWHHECTVVSFNLNTHVGVPFFILGLYIIEHIFHHGNNCLQTMMVAETICTLTALFFLILWTGDKTSGAALPWQKETYWICLCALWLWNLESRENPTHWIWKSPRESSRWCKLEFKVNKKQ